MSVSVSVEGPATQAGYARRPDIRFETLKDPENRLGEAFGALAVPNGVFVDAEGVVRYVRLGGFSVENPEDRAAVEALMRGGDSRTDPVAPPPPKSADSEREARAMARFREGQAHLRSGRRDAALAAFQSALSEDPDSFIIRKQIWVVAHPERFHPVIDTAWQKEQYRREREAERLRG